MVLGQLLLANHCCWCQRVSECTHCDWEADIPKRRIFTGRAKQMNLRRCCCSQVPGRMTEWHHFYQSTKMLFKELLKCWMWKFCNISGFWTQSLNLTQCCRFFPDRARHCNIVCCPRAFYTKLPFRSAGQMGKHMVRLWARSLEPEYGLCTAAIKMQFSCC